MSALHIMTNTQGPILSPGASNSVYKSLVTRRRAVDSTNVRQGKVDKVTDDLEME